jgi:uncharacterized protein (DUF2249 family)
VKSKENQLWVATFQDVTKYIRERQRSRVVTSRRGDVIEVVLRHDLDPALYDLPLTLKTKVPAGWSVVEVRQGSRVARVDITPDGDKGSVTYQAIPNGEPVTLANATK